MEVKLRNFRCYESREFTFASGLNLIKGASGIGKSTILEAVYWCLYSAISDVYPHTQSKCFVGVQIILPNLTITRTFTPPSSNLLTVVHKGIEYSGPNATSLIESIFGPADFFCMSSYINQKSSNDFAALPQKKKLKILSDLAFVGVNPNADLERLDSLIREKRNRIDMSKSDIDRKNAYLSGYVNANSITNTDEKTAEQLAELMQERSEKVSRYSICQEQQRLRGIRLSEQAALTSSINQIDLTLKNFTAVKPNIAISLDELNAEKSRRILYESYTMKLQTLQSIVFDDLPNYTEQDYAEALTKENAHRKMQELSRRLNVSISNKEAKLNEIGTILKSVPEIERNIALRNQLMKLPNIINPGNVIEMPVPVLPEMLPYPESNDTEITSIRQQISDKHTELHKSKTLLTELQATLSLLVCPHCTGALRFANNKLNKSDVAPASEDEILSVKERIKQIENEISLCNAKINALQQEFSSKIYAVNTENARRNALYASQQSQYNNNLRLLEQKKAYEQNEAIKQKLQGEMTSIPMYTAEQIESFRQMKNSLNDLISTELPTVSSNEILRILNLRKQQVAKNELLSALQAIELKYPQYPSSIIISDEINRITREISRYEYETNEKKSLLLRKEELMKKEIIVPDDVSNEMNELSARITQIDNLCRRAEFYRNALMQHQEISRANSMLTEWQIELERNLKFRQIFRNVEHATLQSCVDEINSMLSLILSRVFDSPIVLTMELQKKIKTTKEIKPFIHFSIHYRGATLDSLRSFSGGEEKRVAMALLCALAQMVKSPFCMFDETFGPLDDELRSIVLSVISEYLPNKIILIVNHDGSEGQYASTCNLLS